MIYLSQLLNQKVWDGFGHVVGKLDDIMVNSTEKNMPRLLLWYSKTRWMTKR